MARLGISRIKSIRAELFDLVSGDLFPSVYGTPVLARATGCFVDLITHHFTAVIDAAAAVRHSAFGSGIKCTHGCVLYRVIRSLAVFGSRFIHQRRQYPSIFHWCPVLCFSTLTRLVRSWQHYIKINPIKLHRVQ